MGREDPDQAANRTISGLIFGMVSFLIWGISPLFWKALGHVPAFEIVLHRIVWSFVFLLPLVLMRKKWSAFAATLKNRRAMLILLASTFLVSCNWLIYIWAVNAGHLLQASLGYYINPLVNVFLGMVFLREKLRRPQVFAVLLAALGVLYLTIFFGQFPWIALTLAFSFGLYGLIHKTMSVGSLVGLTIETLIAAIPASIYLVYLDQQGRGFFLNQGTGTDLLLMTSSLVTAVPLLFFSFGTRRLQLSTVGLLQYLAPSCMFLMAVFLFDEPFFKAQIISFCMIWTALAIYSTDSVNYYNRHRGQ
ncbi:MAG: EamA family transporter RarD [Thermodesulfobacteriota bacterium]